MSSDFLSLASTRKYSLLTSPWGDSDINDENMFVFWDSLKKQFAHNLVWETAIFFPICTVYKQVSLDNADTFLVPISIRAEATARAASNAFDLLHELISSDTDILHMFTDS